MQSAGLKLRDQETDVEIYFQRFFFFLQVERFTKYYLGFEFNHGLT
jgi:hypothetical protein